MKKLIAIIGLLLIFSCSSLAKDVAPDINTETATYMRNMQMKIKKSWTPPKLDTKQTIVLLYEINKNGKVISARIKKSSGNIALDESALQALYSAQPFGKFPDAKLKTINVEFTFDYNMCNKKK